MHPTHFIYCTCIRLQSCTVAANYECSANGWSMVKAVGYLSSLLGGLWSRLNRLFACCLVSFVVTRYYAYCGFTRRVGGFQLLLSFAFFTPNISHDADENLVERELETRTHKRVNFCNATPKRDARIWAGLMLHTV